MPDQPTPWEQLSIETAQVLFCDLQNQIVARSKTNSPETLRKSAGVLLQLAKLFRLPATFSLVPEEQKAPEMIPEFRNEVRNNPTLRPGLSKWRRPGENRCC